MGSFRSAPSRRQSDLRTLTHADRPMLNGRPLADDEWLAPGEWVQYWHVLPHSSVTTIAGAGTEAIFGRDGTPQSVRYDAGRAIRARISAGIVDWKMADENGVDVVWNPAQADSLLDGIPAGLYQLLSKVIGKGDPEPSLASPDPIAEPDAAGEVPTLGEGSAESSTPS